MVTMRNETVCDGKTDADPSLRFASFRMTTMRRSSKREYSPTYSSFQLPFDHPTSQGATSTLPLSHPVQMPEPACTQEHQREQQQVVTRMHHHAGREGSHRKPHPAEDQADADEQEKWPD